MQERSNPLADAMQRVRVISTLDEVAHLTGELGYAEPNPSGYPNWVVFLDIDGNDVPSYFGRHELACVA